MLQVFVDRAREFAATLSSRGKLLGHALRRVMVITLTLRLSLSLSTLTHTLSLPLPLTLPLPLPLTPFCNDRAPL